MGWGTLLVALFDTGSEQTWILNRQLLESRLDAPSFNESALLYLDIGGAMPSVRPNLLDTRIV